MNDFDSRQITRDSLYILADLRLDGQSGMHRVKVRNLSAGGLMGEGELQVRRGTLVQVRLRNAGWVDGSVAWVQGNRFGVAFRQEIDPKAVRDNRAATQQQGASMTRQWAAQPPRSGSVRKIL